MDIRTLDHIRRLPLLSLQEMSLEKTVTILCNDRKLLDLIVECNLEKNLCRQTRLCVRKTKEWKSFQAMANEMVSQICDSVLLQKRILGMLWPVSYKIMLWREIYAPSISNTFLQHFYWTDRGTIDNTRTASYIIGNKNISVRRRFVLACSVCLKEEIKEIWREMSNEDKAYFLKENDEKVCPLTLLWAHFLEGSNNVLELYMEEAVRCASEYGLVEAVKYLYTAIPEDKNLELSPLCMDELLVNLRSGQLLEKDHVEICYYALLEMGVEAQKDFFIFNTELVLPLLLHSAEYERCLTLLSEKLPTACEYDFSVFLQVIFYTYHFEVDIDEDCRNLFIDVWRLIPSSIRRSETLTSRGVEFLCVLIRDDFPFILEKEAFNKISEVTSRDLNSDTSVKPFEFHQGKWKLLNFLIEEVTTISSLKSLRNNILFILRKRQSNKKAWKRILKFVRYVGSKHSQLKD